MYKWGMMNWCMMNWSVMNWGMMNCYRMMKRRMTHTQITLQPGWCQFIHGLVHDWICVVTSDLLVVLFVHPLLLT